MAGEGGGVQRRDCQLVAAEHVGAAADEESAYVGGAADGWKTGVRRGVRCDV